MVRPSRLKSGSGEQSILNSRGTYDVRLQREKEFGRGVVERKGRNAFQGVSAFLRLREGGNMFEQTERGIDKFLILVTEILVIAFAGFVIVELLWIYKSIR